MVQHLFRVFPVGNYLEWLGTEVHMKKSEIAGNDFATGETITTDNIKLKGQTFQVLDVEQPHKLLGVCISLKGDSTAEKQHVLKTMQELVQALREDQWLTQTLKELAVKIGIIPFFRYTCRRGSLVQNRIGAYHHNVAGSVQTGMDPPA